MRKLGEIARAQAAKIAAARRRPLTLMLTAADRDALSTALLLAQRAPSNKDYTDHGVTDREQFRATVEAIRINVVEG